MDIEMNTHFLNNNSTPTPMDTNSPNSPAKVNSNNTSSSRLLFNNGTQINGQSDEKLQSWQMDLLMEKMRQKSNKTNSLETISKNIKIALNERRCILDQGDKLHLQKCLDNLQQSIKVNSLQSMVERLEMISRQHGLKFNSSPNGNEWFISSDMFYLELLIDPNGLVLDVKIQHDGKHEQQSCPEMVNCLRSNDFQDFSSHLEGFISVYQLPNTDTKIKNKAFVALQALETDLSAMSSTYLHFNDGETIVMRSLLGLLIPRRDGHPATLVYFISPYEFLDPKTKSTLPTDVNTIIEKKLGTTATISIQGSVQNKLQMSTTVSIMRTPDGKNVPRYGTLNTTNSTALPAVFTVNLSKPMPMCKELLGKIENTVGIRCCDDTVMANAESILNLITKTASNGVLDAGGQKGLFVSLPDQLHCYFMTETSLLEGVLLSKISFTLASQLPQLISILRQQLTFNTLVESCVRVGTKPDMNNIVFEVNALSYQNLSVSFQHPLEDSLVSLEFDLRDVSHPQCHLHATFSITGSTTADILPTLEEFACKVVQRSLSIPVTLRAVIKRWKSMKPKYRPQNPDINIRVGGSSDPNIGTNSQMDISCGAESNQQSGQVSGGTNQQVPGMVAIGKDKDRNIIPTPPPPVITGSSAVSSSGRKTPNSSSSSYTISPVSSSSNVTTPPPPPPPPSSSGFPSLDFLSNYMNPLGNNPALTLQNLQNLQNLAPSMNLSALTMNMNLLASQIQSQALAAAAAAQKGNTTQSTSQMLLGLLDQVQGGNKAGRRRKRKGTTDSNNGNPSSSIGGGGGNNVTGPMASPNQRPSPSPSPKSPKLLQAAQMMGRSPKRRPSESSEHSEEGNVRIPTPHTPLTPSSTAIGLLMSELGLDPSCAPGGSNWNVDITPVSSNNNNNSITSSAPPLQETNNSTLFASKLLSLAQQQNEETNITTITGEEGIIINNNNNNNKNLLGKKLSIQKTMGNKRDIAGFPKRSISLDSSIITGSLGISNNSELLMADSTTTPSVSIGLQSLMNAAGSSLTASIAGEHGHSTMAGDFKPLVTPSLSITPVASTSNNPNSSSSSGSFSTTTSSSVNSLLAAIRPGIEIIPIIPTSVQIPNSITVTPILPKTQQSQSQLDNSGNINISTSSASSTSIQGQGQGTNNNSNMPTSTTHQGQGSTSSSTSMSSMSSMSSIKKTTIMKDGNLNKKSSTSSSSSGGGDLNKKERKRKTFSEDFTDSPDFSILAPTSKQPKLSGLGKPNMSVSLKSMSGTAQGSGMNLKKPTPSSPTLMQRSSTPTNNSSGSNNKNSSQGGSPTSKLSIGGKPSVSTMKSVSSGGNNGNSSGNASFGSKPPKLTSGISKEKKNVSGGGMKIGKNISTAHAQQVASMMPSLKAISGLDTSAISSGMAGPLQLPNLSQTSAAAAAFMAKSSAVASSTTSAAAVNAAQRKKGGSLLDNIIGKLKSQHSTDSGSSSSSSSAPTTPVKELGRIDYIKASSSITSDVMQLQQKKGSSNNNNNSGGNGGGSSTSQTTGGSVGGNLSPTNPEYIVKPGGPGGGLKLTINKAKMGGSGPNRDKTKPGLKNITKKVGPAGLTNKPKQGSVPGGGAKKLGPGGTGKISEKDGSGGGGSGGGGNNNNNNNSSGSNNSNSKSSNNGSPNQSILKGLSPKARPDAEDLTKKLFMPGSVRSLGLESGLFGDTPKFDTSFQIPKKSRSSSNLTSKDNNATTPTSSTSITESAPIITSSFSKNQSLISESSPANATTASTSSTSSKSSSSTHQHQPPPPSSTSESISNKESPTKEKAPTPMDWSSSASAPNSQPSSPPLTSLSSTDLTHFSDPFSTAPMNLSSFTTSTTSLSVTKSTENITAASENELDSSPPPPKIDKYNSEETATTTSTSTAITTTTTSTGESSTTGNKSSSSSSSSSEALSKVVSSSEEAAETTPAPKATELPSSSSSTAEPAISSSTNEDNGVLSSIVSPQSPDLLAGSGDFPASFLAHPHLTSPPNKEEEKTRTPTPTPSIEKDKKIDSSIIVSSSVTVPIESKTLTDTSQQPVIEQMPQPKKVSVEDEDEDRLIMDLPDDKSDKSGDKDKEKFASSSSAALSEKGEMTAEMPPPPPPILLENIASPLSSQGFPNSPKVPVLSPSTSLAAQVHIVHSPAPTTGPASPALLPRSPLVVASPHSSKNSPYSIDDDLMDEAITGGGK